MVRPSPVTFHVPGLPISQGSKRHVGGGRMIESSRKLEPWRAKVASDAARVMERDDRRLFDGVPLWMACAFVFWRPKTHYRSGKYAELLKPTAPSQPITYPDTEKLVRAVNDAIEGIVFRNDSQVVKLYAEKLYGERLGAWIAIGPISEVGDFHRLLAATDGDLLQAVGVQEMLA